LLTPPPDDDELLLEDEPHFLWRCFTFTCPNGAGNIMAETGSYKRQEINKRPTSL